MKKTTKKILSAALSIIMLLSALPFGGFARVALFSTTASAAYYSGNCSDNLIWNLDTEIGELEINGSGDMDDYSDSSSVPWGLYASEINSVIINDGVTSIGDFAFAALENLTNVIISDSVSYIGKNSFLGCISLESVNISDNITIIGENAFGFYADVDNEVFMIPNFKIYCNEFSAGYNYAIENGFDYETDDTQTHIDENRDYICDYCGQIMRTVLTQGYCGEYGNNEYVLFDNGELVISGEEAMEDFSEPEFAPWYDFRFDITSLTVSYGITSIGNLLFYMYSNLASVTVSDSVTSIGNSAFSGCSSLSHLSISSSVLSVGEYSFCDCDNLTSVIIPKSVTSIGEYSFGYTTENEELIKNPDFKIYCFDNSVGLDYAIENGFEYEVLDPHIHIVETEEVQPACTTEGYIKTYCSECEEVLSIDVIPAAGHIYEVDDTICDVCGQPKEAIFEQGECGEDGDNATFTINNAVELVISGTGSMANYESDDFVSSNAPWDLYRYDIMSITISDGITSIGNAAFAGCMSLADITIPDSVKHIGEAAFAYCVSLSNVTIPKSVTSIGEYALGYIDNDELSKTPNFKIYCYNNSAGLDYAIENHFDYEILDPHTHSYGAVSYTWTADNSQCTAECSCSCGDLLSETVDCVATVTQQSGCTQPELTTYTATFVTNDAFESQVKADVETKPETGHTSSDWIIDKEASCSESGSKHKECTVCQEILENDTVERKQHTPNGAIIEDEVPASCTQNGTYNEVVYCSECNEKLSSTEKTTEKLAHTPSQWIIDLNPTCTELGSKHKECTACQEILENDTVEKKQHTPNGAIIEDEVPASCTQNGTYNEVVYCSECNVKLSTTEKTTEKLAHTPSEWIIDLNPTCSESGSKHKECTACHEILETATAEKKQHTPNGAIIEDEVPASCTQNGTYNEVVYCSECNEKLSSTEKTTEKLAHTPSQWIIDLNPTCSTEGSKHKECTVCHETLENGTVEKKTHIVVTVPGTSATCTKPGKTGGAKCSVCGIILTAQLTVAATGNHKDNNHDGKCDTCDKVIVPTAGCDCRCHKDGFQGFIYKIIRIFWKLFGINQTCQCGVRHY